MFFSFTKIWTFPPMFDFDKWYHSSKKNWRKNWFWNATLIQIIAQTTDQSTGPKFRLVLPVGQAPPPGYVQVGKRTLPMGEQLSPDQFDQKAPPHHDYVQLPSGVVLQELPAIYLTERDWYARRSSSPLDSGKNKSIIGLALTTKTSLRPKSQ